MVSDSENRFGYEWKVYDEMDSNYEIQFRKWMHPLDKKFMQGKRVLDAACGMGRNSYWCLQWGASEVVAFDNDDRTVAAAKKLLGNNSHAIIKKENIYDIEYENEFDFVFSIGVVHHMQYPEKAIKNFERALKPGGIMLVWLYGYENNEKLLKILDPVRKYFTSKLPPAVLHVLTYGVSIPFWIGLHIMRPKKEYYKQVRSFSFLHLHSIIFDQLLPHIARYYRKEEAIKLLVDGGLTNVKAYHTNGMSWTVIGMKR
jgi:SAM-dependent methyltransferase